MKRLYIQIIAALAQNPFLYNFLTGRIYQGGAKAVCTPGLNCYSCPAAAFSCPIGALQAGLADRRIRFPFYVVGFLLLIGVTLGRFVCGFLCPFGLLFDLLYRIPFFKKIRTFPGDRALRYLKYVLLAVFVLLLPAFFMDGPAYCRFICPQGTLQGGVLLLLGNRLLWPLVGALYAWKVGILIAVLLLSLLLYRPFCKYLCPLGAVYGLCNPFSLYRLRVNREQCVGCGVCKTVCRMGVDPIKTPNSPECIRCGACAQSCPKGALRQEWSVKS
ncbi:MAG: 4Fe-4S binding protein [Clostridiales bacterium]|nr:4Fe-4S binding protein [Clostridiales bacterium]